MKTRKVNDLASFEFWVNMFKPRPEQWQRDTLKRLNTETSAFETAEENLNKRQALEFLLNE